MLSFTFQLFHSSFLFLFSRFVSSSFVGIAIVELWWRKRERERDEEKGKEKEGKETRQKVGTIQLVVRVSQPLNWITVAVTAGRELLFNSLKLYAWCFRYLSRQPLLSAITPCTLSLAESLDYYTFIPAPAVSLSSSSIPSNTTPPPSLSFSPPPSSQRFTLIFTFSFPITPLFPVYPFSVPHPCLSSSVISLPFKPFLSSPVQFLFAPWLWPRCASSFIDSQDSMVCTA